MPSPKSAPINYLAINLDVVTVPRLEPIEPLGVEAALNHPLDNGPRSSARRCPEVRPVGPRDLLRMDPAILALHSAGGIEDVNPRPSPGVRQPTDGLGEPEIIDPPPESTSALSRATLIEPSMCGSS